MSAMVPDSAVARTGRKSSQGKAEAGVFVYINNSWCDEKETLLKPSAPRSGISYASVSTILATEGIYSDHNHGCLYRDLFGCLRSIKAAKRQYKNKVEEHFNNPRNMWQGINNITGFKGKSATVNIAASLPNELNPFMLVSRLITPIQRALTRLLQKR